MRSVLVRGRQLRVKNDVSVKLKFAKGNYTDAAISLLTYYRGHRWMKFLDLR